MERLKERYITEFLSGEYIKKTAEFSQEIFSESSGILLPVLFNILLQVKWLEYQMRN